MLATYRALLARWTIVGWRRVRVLDHGHTGGVFKVRKVGSRVTEQKGSDLIATVNYHRYAKQSSAELIAEGAIS